MGCLVLGIRMLLFAGLSVMGFGLLGWSEAQKVPGMYVFGDSLVDVGNNNHLESILKADFPHNGVDYPRSKPTGRFSNGKNAADFLAENVNLPTAPPYLANTSGVFLQGVSFASGGAGIFNSSDNSIFAKCISLSEQVSYFSLVHQRLIKLLGPVAAQRHLSKSLFPVIIGSNDLLGYFGSGSKVGKTRTPQQHIDLMISTLEDTLKRLYILGARKFVITGVPPIGCCPSQRHLNQTGECHDIANFWATKYNAGLKMMLQGLKTKLNDINYSYYDTYSALFNIIQKPSAYGFTEVKAACCGLGRLNANIPCIPISQYCSNRAQHLFWDLYHPTEAAARIIVNSFFTDSEQYITPINVNQLIAL